MKRPGDTTSTESQGPSKRGRNTQQTPGSRDPKRWGGTSPGEPTFVHLDAARLVVDELKKHPEFRTASKSLRGVASAFHSEVPFKTNPTFNQVYDFIEEFSRDEEWPLASSIEGIRMPETDGTTNRSASDLEKLLSVAPNLSTMTVPVTVDGKVSTRVGVLSDKRSDRPTLTTDSGTNYKSTNDLTSSGPMTVNPFPYSKNLNIQVSRQMQFYFNGRSAKTLAANTRSLSERDPPVGIASGIALSCFGSAPDRDNGLSLLTELIKSHNRYGSVNFTVLSLDQSDPTIDDYSNRADIYEQADDYGHRIDKCTFRPSSTHSSTPSLQQILTHPTLIKSFRASETVLRVNTLGYPIHQGGFKATVTGPRQIGREVCIDIGDQAPPDIASTAKDTLGYPKDIFFTFASNGDKSTLDRFTQAVRDERSWQSSARS